MYLNAKKDETYHQNYFPASVDLLRTFSLMHHLESESFGKQPENGRVPSALLCTGSENGIFTKKLYVSTKVGPTHPFLLIF